jgi:hypothetical protein
MHSLLGDGCGDGFCPEKGRHFRMIAAVPLQPQKRTFIGAMIMPAWADIWVAARWRID